MNVYTLLNEVVFAAVEALIIMLLVLAISNKGHYLKDAKHKVAFFVVFYTIFSYYTTSYVPVGYHTVLIMIFAVINLTLTAELSFGNAVMGFAIVMAIMIVTEFPIVFIFSAVSGVNISDIITNPQLKLLLTITVKAVQFSGIALLFRSGKSHIKFLSSSKENTIAAYIVFGVCLMGIFVSNINYAANSGESMFIYELLLFAIFILYIILGFIIIKEKEQLLRIQHKYKLQEAYVNNIETLLNVVRREKHDFSNHINTISAMCILNKPDAVDRIKTYIDRLTCNLQSSYHYYNTGNDYVDGLLAVKSNFAFDHNIHLEVDFEALLDQVTIDSFDLISIMGNIIDNAFEAVLLNPEHEKKIVSITSYIEEGNYYLSISNNGPMIPQDHLDMIFSNGFSTKENNKDDHGLGLFIVKQLIQKNQGDVRVSSSEEETEFSIKFDRWKIKDGEISATNYQLNTNQ